MTIAAYLDAMKERFVTDPIVTGFPDYCLDWEGRRHN